MIEPIDFGRKDSKPIKKTTYEHKEIINQLLKTIEDTYMDHELKMILRMRIWGKTPSNFDPLNHAEIAIDIRASEEQVREWEREALYYVKQHMNKHSVQDSINRFNANRALKNRLFDPDGKIIIP